MDLKALIEQLTALISKFNRNQKIALVVAFVAVIGFIAALVVFNMIETKKGDDGYRVLFESLSAKDAALVVQQLEKDKIIYKIPREGTIEVPREVVEKERMAIAAQGIPKDSKVGFELFDKQEFGATDFDQNVKYLRALEGELARTIGSLNVINDAKVHIALPKESVFVTKEALPTASVVLKLKDGMTLNPKQISGIKNLIAAAVTKMTVENVKIVNENGEPLDDSAEDVRNSEVIKQQMKYKKDYEKAYEEKILKVLSPIVGGEEHVVAKVTIDFDFTQKEATSETYDPNSVVRSEQTSEEKREGPGTIQVGGVPGAVSNIGPVEGINNQTAGEKYSKNTATTNFEISKTVSSTKGEFATIKRITAAVVVDGRYEAKVDNPEEKIYKAMTPQDLTNITGLVNQSIGYSTARNDQVSVTNFQFAYTRTDLTGLNAKIGTMKNALGSFEPIVKYLLIGIFLFIFYKKVIAPFAQRMTEIPVEEEAKGFDVFEEEAEPESEFERLKAQRKRLEDEFGFNGADTEESLRYEVLLDKIKIVIDEKPEELAHLFQTLVRDEIENSNNNAKKL